MNSYNIFQIGHESTILYHAIASCEEHVVQLAKEKGIKIQADYVIELESTNIKDQLGNPYEPKIEDAIIK